MNASRNNLKRQQLRTGLEALTAVLLVNLLFLVLFQYAPVQAPAPAVERPRITLLNLGDDEQVAPGFLKWLEYHDPSLFIRPDRQYGYGAWGMLTLARPEVMLPVAAVRPVQPGLPMAVPPRLGVMQPLRQNWSELLAPVVLIDLPPLPAARKYPQVSFNGRPVAWAVPAALAAQAEALGVTESSVKLAQPAAEGLPMRWDLGAAGSEDAGWRRDLYRAVMDDARELTGGEAGELTIRWRGRDAGGGR